MNTTASEYAKANNISTRTARRVLARFPSRIVVEPMSEHSINHRSLRGGMKKRVRVYDITP